ncbi:unnamed protein product [Caenorhabditis auriculariae]|uniref:28S ribosomal protein S27, mitochondrial n=1 Tax=Caenorhabditis auriculariae TaxID=2777116 RepID=A0A8S1GQP2_9PELO|nr:unnamed protein product [Caenorhabditis auriculariae]
MLRKCATALSRKFSTTGVFRVLSPSFSLDQEWTSRHNDLNRLGLGGDYEWISAVQKKFIGGGIASAVDVDAAVCIAEQKDQVEDVLELLYKLRHSENASDLAESSEYAIVRLLLNHQPETVFKFANDPINYGVFLNAHVACLAIDHFLKANNVQGAARLVSWIMQQEDTDNELVNTLSLYVCAKWAELPADQQTMPLPVVDEEEVNDDDIRTFKFPYLKNEFFDSHFDLNNPHHLVGKSLLWISRDTKCLDENLRTSLRLLGAVLYSRLDLASTLASSSTAPSVISLVRKQLQPTEEGAELTEPAQKVIEKFGEPATSAEPAKSLSSTLLEQLEKIRPSEEQKLAEQQKEEFGRWNERRRQLAKAQAERVLLKIRAEEIRAELNELDKNEEKLGFFEKRLMWEKRAAENEEIEREAAVRNSKVAVQNS